MNFTINLKGALTGVILIAATLHSSAQKINEQDLKVKVTDISSPVSKLMNLKPVTFEYDVQKFNKLKLPIGNQYGFLAASVKPEYPEMVFEATKSYGAGKNAFNTAKYDDVQNDQLIPVLVAAIKEQQEQIALLQKELAQLKEKVTL